MDCDGKNHRICGCCWDERNPERPYRGGQSAAHCEICCFCGDRLRTDGIIYVRHTPGKYEPIGCEIDRLYAELGALAVLPANDADARHREELRARLDELEAKDAELLWRRLAERGPLKLGEVDAALQEAREAIAKFDDKNRTEK